MVFLLVLLVLTGLSVCAIRPMTGEPACISAGGDYNCFLRGGKAFCFGGNVYGQLGVNSNTAVGGTPGSMTALTAVGFVVPAGESISRLSAGDGSWCAVFEPSGAVRCLGRNDAYQLGLGTTTPVGNGLVGALSVFAISPLPFADTVPAVAVAVGTFHACGLFASGLIRCWGDGTVGRLGYNSADNVPFAANATYLNFGTDPAPAVSVTAGSHHTCAVFSVGRAKCWGSGSLGRLGSSSPFNIGDGGATSVSLSAAPYITFGTDQTTLIDLDAGALHTCALFVDGRVKCWGSSAAGQLGLDQTQSVGSEPGSMAALAYVPLGAQAVQISCGAEHSCALLVSGRIKCWGQGAGGRLGTGSIASAGAGAGSTPMSQLAPVALPGDGLTPVARVTAGGAHTCMLLVDGRVFCLGSGASGQLGVDSTASSGNVCGPVAQALLGSAGGPTCAASALRDTTSASFNVAALNLPVCALGSVLSVGGVCVGCAAGSYYSSTTARCEPCPAGTSRDQPSATALAQCLPCALGTTSAAGSASCSPCPRGTYAPFPGACVGCGVGFFGSAAPSSTAASFASVCRACPSGALTSTDTAASAADCRCPGVSVLVDGACVCPPGHTRNGTFCDLCPVTHFKPLAGDQPCTPCPAGLAVSARPATNLTACGCDWLKNGAGIVNSTAAATSNASTTSVADLLGCGCLPGFVPANGTCVACPNNTFKAGVGGDGPCVPCPGNTRVPTRLFPGRAVDECRCDHLRGTVLDAGTGRCVCGSGLGLGITLGGGAAPVLPLLNSTSVCAPCPPGSYKPLPGDGPCLACPERAFLNASGVCGCAANAEVSSNSSACECLPGFGWNAASQTCVACDPRFYKPESGNTACVACPAMSTVRSPPGTSISSCVCMAHSNPIGDKCVCDPGYYSPDLLHSEGSGADRRSAHRSLAGLHTIAPEQSSPCQPCPAGTFRNDTSQVACTACPRGTTTDAAWLGCKCAPGYYQLDLGAPASESNCPPCPEGALCAGGGAALKARAGYALAEGSRDRLFACPLGAVQCGEGNTCRPGYAGPLCSGCAPGYYRSANMGCTDCRSHRRWGWLVFYILCALAVGLLAVLAATAQEPAALLIVLNYVQCLAQLDFPSAQTRLIEWFPALELHLFLLTPDTCIFSQRFQGQWMFWTLVPLVYLAFLAAVLALARLVRGPAYLQGARVPARAAWFILTATYYVSLNHAIGGLTCRELIPGVSPRTLRWNAGLLCWTRQHQDIAGVAIFVVIVFGVGLPLAALAFAAGDVVEPAASFAQRARAALAPLLRSPYRPGGGFQFWELVNFARRAAFIVFTKTLLDHGEWRDFCLIVTLGLLLALNGYCRPHRRHAHNLLEALLLLALLVTFLLKALHHGYSQRDAVSAENFAVAILVLNAVCFAWGLFVVLGGKSVGDSGEADDILKQPTSSAASWGAQHHPHEPGADAAAAGGGGGGGGGAGGATTLSKVRGFTEEPSTDSGDNSSSLSSSSSSSSYSASGLSTSPSSVPHTAAERERSSARVPRLPMDTSAILDAFTKRSPSRSPSPMRPTAEPATPSRLDASALQRRGVILVGGSSAVKPPAARQSSPGAAAAVMASASASASSSPSSSSSSGGEEEDKFAIRGSAARTPAPPPLRPRSPSPKQKQQEVLPAIPAMPPTLFWSPAKSHQNEI
jgi:alpha-tubulin suppressor-like RCC1 family protein